MATAKTVLKKTQTEAIVKVAGSGAAETIDLDVDIVASTETAGSAGTQEVQITGVTWTGAAGGVITITRNSVTIMTLQANNQGHIDFLQSGMFPDNVENDQNIVVTISGAQAECWLRLRKSAGYNTKIQPEQYGIYDDQTSTSA